MEDKKYEISLVDLIERERAALGPNQTKITLETFLAWKKKKIKEKQVFFRLICTIVVYENIFYTQLSYKQNMFVLNKYKTTGSSLKVTRSKIVDYFFFTLQLRKSK